MPSPLPGMDPYLEHPSAWANIHHRLITAIAADLAPRILVPDLTIQQSRSAVMPSDEMGGVAMAEPSTQANHSVQW
jgi:hypothetical protein